MLQSVLKCLGKSQKTSAVKAAKHAASQLKRKEDACALHGFYYRNSMNFTTFKVIISFILWLGCREALQEQQTILCLVVTMGVRLQLK